MTNDEKFSIATQLFVQLRRNGGRIIDVIWAITNVDYAREVLRIARATRDSKIEQLADRFEQLALGAVKQPASLSSADDEPAAATKYVDTLR